MREHAHEALRLVRTFHGCERRAEHTAAEWFHLATQLTTSDPERALGVLTSDRAVDAAARLREAQADTRDAVEEMRAESMRRRAA